jgi:hypothetical protein
MCFLYKLNPAAKPVPSPVVYGETNSIPIIMACCEQIALKIQIKTFVHNSPMLLGKNYSNKAHKTLHQIFQKTDILTFLCQDN